MKLASIGVNYVQQAWPQVKEFIQAALVEGNEFPDWAADYNADHVLQYLTSGQWLLIVALDEKGAVHGACTVSFINYPLHRVAFITTIGGKLVSSKDTVQQLKDVLKAHGATKIQGYGRESIVRLWGRYNFEPRNTLVEVLI